MNNGRLKGEFIQNCTLYFLPRFCETYIIFEKKYGIPYLGPYLRNVALTHGCEEGYRVEDEILKKTNDLRRRFKRPELKSIRMPCCWKIELYSVTLICTTNEWNFLMEV